VKKIELLEEQEQGFLHFAVGFVLGCFCCTGFGGLFGCVCKCHVLSAKGCTRGYSSAVKGDKRRQV